jgi:hypothetical protein
MTQLIEPTDPRYFTVSSTDLYDRHHYKVVSQNGESIIVDNWEDVNIIWWNKNAFLSHVEVLDAQKPKGFK